MVYLSNSIFKVRDRAARSRLMRWWAVSKAVIGLRRMAILPAGELWGALETLAFGKQSGKATWSVKHQLDVTAHTGLLVRGPYFYCRKFGLQCRKNALAQRTPIKECKLGRSISG